MQLCITVIRGTLCRMNHLSINYFYICVQFLNEFNKHSTLDKIANTDNWSELLSPRELRVKVGADLHLYDQGNIFCNQL